MDQYLIYLRKSRQDRDLEAQTGCRDTLQRHRDALTALARQRGWTVARIYEEVVSGDTIAERPEMRRLLSAVETGNYAGVLVMEVPRLARGNTRDQGIVAETFQYSRTKIITPEKIYDPADEADEEYFEFGLFLSRREYKAINRRLQRGRMASLNEGKYIAGTAPYGYRRVKLPQQRGYSLEPDPEQADVVRDIFRLYTEGEPDDTRTPPGSRRIASLLNQRGLPSPGGVLWSASAVRDILKNPTYAGYLRWAYRPEQKRMVDGRVVHSTPINHGMELRNGIHPPLISHQTWMAAQTLLSSRGHAPVPGKQQLSNPLAGLLYCSICGRPMTQQRDQRGPMLLCPTQGCPTVGCRRDAAEAALLDALWAWLGSRPIAAALPDSPHSAEQTLAAAERELSRLEQRKQRLFDLLEQGVYTPTVFQDRSRLLDQRTAEALRRIAALRESRPAELHAPPPRSIPELYAALESAGERNTLLKTVLHFAVYSKTAVGSAPRLFLYPKVSRDF